MWCSVVSILARLRGSVLLRMVLLMLLRCCSTVRWEALVGVAVAVVELPPPAVQSMLTGPFGPRGFWSELLWGAIVMLLCCAAASAACATVLVSALLVSSARLVAIVVLVHDAWRFWSLLSLLFTSVLNFLSPRWRAPERHGERPTTLRWLSA